MKKIGARSNPLREYRRLLREIRAMFDPFTTRHCPACETPCCRRPSRVTPLDVVIAANCGADFSRLGSRDPVALAAEHAEQRLGPGTIGLEMAGEDQADNPCEFLDGARCIFPDDLRPYGCVAFICQPVHRHMPEVEMRRLKRLVRLLGEAHDALLRALGDEQRI